MIDGADYINNFPGTARRMEKLTEGLYTDYAHHPEEIAATVEMAMEMSDKVIVVYQPHQNIRQHEIMDAYTDCFEGTNRLYWLPTYMSREDPSLDTLSPDQLMENLTNRQVAEAAELNDDLVQKIRGHIADGALVVGMAAGDLDAWLRDNFLGSEA